MVVVFDASAGRFRFHDRYDEIVRALDEALDQRDAGELSLQSYVVRLEALVEQNPDFIDGHAHLGYALFELGKPKVALDACLRGYAVGERAVPAGFDGLIEWEHSDNRPILRAMHGAMLCYLHLGQRQKAIRLMEQALVWNPTDNQGIRHVIGSEYLRSGRRDRAKFFFVAEAHHYPPYHYDHALLLLLTGDFAAAATSLRQGFLANVYVAEMLSGAREVDLRIMWHGSNLAGPDLAVEYMARHAELWRTTPNALAFLRWLYNHPKVLMERAVVFDLREELLWEHDYDRRRIILARMDVALGCIDGQLSGHIVIGRTDRNGRSVLPWLFNPAIQV